MSEQVFNSLGALLKAHVSGYTRSDGVFVKDHDNGRDAAAPEQPSVGAPASSAAVNAISAKHGSKIHRKESEWVHSGKAIPHDDVSGLPEFSHQEVYGHGGKSSPAGSDFQQSFAAKGHKGFVLKHGDGKRSFVDTQGSNYARYHAPVEASPSDGGAPSISANHAALSASSKSGELDHEVNQSAAEYMKQGDKKTLSAVLNNADTAARDHILDHIHPDHWEGLGFNPLNKDLSVAQYEKKFGVGNNSDSGKPAARKTATKKPVARKPATVKTNNEGYGYHGEAFSSHVANVHGPDTYHGSLSEADAKKANDAADKSFSDAAGKLVDGGHFDSHEQARDYLDSKHGRHLHDGATFHGGDISKVKWLVKDVASYKKSAGGQLKKSLAELELLNKSMLI